MSPDYITVSGREDLSLSDRIDLLEANLMRPPFFGTDSLTPAVNRTIHDLKITIGYVRDVIDLYRAARKRGKTDEQLSAGAVRFIAPAECWVLAWFRGGHAEWKRIRDLQRKASTSSVS